MNNEIEKTNLGKRIVSAKYAADHIRDGMTLAMSGYAMAGYPKAIVHELVERSRNREKLSINLITSANVPWLDEILSEINFISSRTPMIAHSNLASQVNKGKVKYIEQQMSKMPRLIKSGRLGKIDVAVIEVLAITESGLVPTSSSGFTHLLIEAADSLIVEINSAQPKKLKDLHDIYTFQEGQPIPITRLQQRIGGSFIPVDAGKILYIVKTDISECEEVPAIQSTQQLIMIAQNLFDFLMVEYRIKEGGSLPPIQMGFGNIADAIADAFSKSGFHDLKFFCGGVAQPVMELLASGKASVIITGGLKMSKRVEEIINMPEIENKLILRNGDLMNNAEIIGRLGVLALNTAIEMDIYGNVNTSHIGGTRVVNGIGGSANFAQNAGLSVMIIPSISKKGAISNIVPMVSHQDISEHDIDVVITENGVCDLRGLDDTERANGIIQSCAASEYRDELLAYLEKAKRKYPGHHPQIPEDAFAWYRRLKETGSMR